MRKFPIGVFQYQEVSNLAELICPPHAGIMVMKFDKNHNFMIHLSGQIKKKTEGFF